MEALLGSPEQANSSNWETGYKCWEAGAVPQESKKFGFLVTCHASVCFFVCSGIADCLFCPLARIDVTVD